MEYKPAKIERHRHMRAPARSNLVRRSTQRDIHVRDVQVTGAPTEVMIVDPDLWQRGRVTEAFRGAGCQVLEAGTALEALDRIKAATCPMAVIAVADTLPKSADVALRDYLDGAEPGGAHYRAWRCRMGSGTNPDRSVE
jgi:hypothetical protein